MNEDNSWLIVPIMLGGMLGVGVVMALLIEFLPQGEDHPMSGFIFVSGMVLAVAGVTAVIMTIAITQLGCCV